MRMTRSWSISSTDVSAAQEHNRLVLREALATALRVTGAPMGNAQLFDPVTRDLRISVQRGFHHPFLSFFRRVETVADASSCGAAAQLQLPVYVPDVHTSPLFVGTTALEVLQDAGVSAVASVPVFSPTGDLIGMISTHHTWTTAWSGDLRAELHHLSRTAGRLTRVP